MNNNKKMKSILSFTLAFMIVITSSPVYGAKARFRDVPKSRWSYEHVEKMAKLGYLEGKGNGIFAPTDNLTFLESMAALSRLTKPTKAEITSAKSQYAGLMKELKVTKEWEKEALSVAIYKDIVSANEVRNAKKQNIFHKPIQKVAASVFLAKAMGLEEKANSLSVVFIEYKDVLEIDPSLRKYLKVLLDADVLDVKGDSTGKFNPKQPLRREILATMLSRADSSMHGNTQVKPPKETEKPEPTKPVEPEKPVKPAEKEKETIKGIIVKIAQEKGKEVLFIEDSRGRESSFIIDKGTTIKVDERLSNMSALKSGQEVVLVIEKDTKKLISIESKILEEEFKGSINYINPISKEIDLEYKESGKIIRKRFTISDDIRIRKDGNLVNLINLKKGDYAEILVRDGKLIDIESKSEEIKIEGTIVEIDETRNGRINLYIESKNRKEVKVLVDKDTQIKRDRKSARPEDLRETDEIYVVARYNIDDDMYLADDIEADVVTKKISGHVLEITNRMNQNPIIILKNRDNGKEESYDLSSEAYISVDGRVQNSLPENPGYEAILYVEGGKDIVEIIIDTSTMETSVVGRIKYIDSKDDYMEIETSSLSRDKEVIRVYVESRTVITDRNLRRLRMRDLFEDDFVNIIGVYKGANFVADTISLR